MMYSSAPGLFKKCSTQPSILSERSRLINNREDYHIYAICCLDYLPPPPLVSKYRTGIFSWSILFISFLLYIRNLLAKSYIAYELLYSIQTAGGYATK